jgi:hypothetical protein
VSDDLFKIAHKRNFNRGGCWIIRKGSAPAELKQLHNGGRIIATAFDSSKGKIAPWRPTLLIKIDGIVMSRGYSQLIPASGSTR